MSPFFGTNLSTQLIALGVDTLLIGGFTTSGNVRAATLDAMQAGFRAMIVGEACGDRGEETHWANLMDLGAKYGDAVSVEDAIEALRGGWR
jgi:nicotinamidase-related amidase